MTTRRVGGGQPRGQSTGSGHRLRCPHGRGWGRGSPRPRTELVTRGLVTAGEASPQGLCEEK